MSDIEEEKRDLEEEMRQLVIGGGMAEFTVMAPLHATLIGRSARFHGTLNAFMIMLDTRVTLTA